MYGGSTSGLRFLALLAILEEDTLILEDLFSRCCGIHVHFSIIEVVFRDIDVEVLIDLVWNDLSYLRCHSVRSFLLMSSVIE